ncbi:MAG: zinc ABC transporter substrate-binding protein [Elusimicrobia bacterium]|nr:zinc ABC transporter substrate-binding protein [Elusimicrobiota bacterium]
MIATIPDLADIARRVGGDRVKVESLAKGTEDIHAVPQRPSFVPRLNRADAVISIGFGAEHAFLPALLEVAQNPKVLPGQPGSIDCSEDIVPLDVAQNLSRSEGEVHPAGNPHYNVDPRKGAAIADAIAGGFSRLDPPGAEAYAKNAAAFKAELAGRVELWRKEAASLRGRKAVSYHRDMVYLAEFLGLAMSGEVEPKPGIAPTPRHLESLANRMNAHRVKLIIREVHFSADSAQWLSQKTGARIAVIAVMGGAFPDSRDYFGFIDHNIKALLEAAK